IYAFCKEFWMEIILFLNSAFFFFNFDAHLQLDQSDKISRDQGDMTIKCSTWGKVATKWKN
ncbi:hypothetical protein PSZ90_24330, partial [Shigella sonnei]|nr:hypothetical protein [Shigella sonnei]